MVTLVTTGLSLAAQLANQFSGSSAAGRLSLNGAEPSPFELMMLQQEVQRESLFFTMQTNISKTEHDARMSAVRNMKA